VVPASKTSSFQIHFFPPTGRNGRLKSGSAAKLSIPALSFLLHSTLPMAGAVCPWPFLLACTAEKP